MMRGEWISLAARLVSRISQIWQAACRLYKRVGGPWQCLGLFFNWGGRQETKLEVRDKARNDVVTEFGIPIPDFLVG